jgi:cytoskeletal protein RodZ
MRRLPIALVLLLVAPLATAQVYKWTDAQGITHYSESPPPGNTKYSQVSVATGSDTSAASSSSAASNSSGDSSQSSSSSTTPAQTPDTPENRAKLCASLKANISTLQGSGPVVMQGPGGEQHLLNADQRKQQLDAGQSQYQQYCSGSDNS